MSECLDIPVIDIKEIGFPCVKITADLCWGQDCLCFLFPLNPIGAIICLLNVLLLIFPRSIGHFFCVPICHCQDWTCLWVCGQTVKLLLRVESGIPLVVSSSLWKLTERHLPASVWRVNRLSQASRVFWLLLLQVISIFQPHV